MIVYTTGGSIVSLEDTDKRSLFDNDGVEWARCPEEDTQDPFGCAYIASGYQKVIRLTRDELKRVIAGPHAMRTPTTVEEMRYYALYFSDRRQRMVDKWSDQQLREVLIEADEKRYNPGVLLETKLDAIIDAEEQERERAEQEEREKISRNAREGTSLARETRGTGKRTPRKKTQEESLSVSTKEGPIVLTPKQLEFMERLSECPGWDTKGVNGSYVASQYAEELSDTMNSMSVGAVLTTLREKGLLTTEKTRMGGVKCCIFTMTDIGIAVYNKLAGKEERSNE